MPDEDSDADIDAEEIADRKRVAADPFGRHEVLHTASLILDLFDRSILDHAAVEYGDEELKAGAERAHDALWDFYQLCGLKFLDDEDPAAASAVERPAG